MWTADIYAINAAIPQIPATPDTIVTVRIAEKLIPLAGDFPRHSIPPPELSGRNCRSGTREGRGFLGRESVEFDAYQNDNRHAEFLPSQLRKGTGSLAPPTNQEGRELVLLGNRERRGLKSLRKDPKKLRAPWKSGPSGRVTYLSCVRALPLSVTKPPQRADECNGDITPIDALRFQPIIHGVEPLSADG